MKNIDAWIQREPDTERTCWRCGEPWPYEWDGCMNPRCTEGERNIDSVKADAAYHRMADEGAI